MLKEDAKLNKVYTNFSLKGIKNYHRLKKTDILTDTIDIEKSTEKKTVNKKVVNWAFWENNRSADIYLDEMHNLINSRSAMSKENKIYSEWLSQIRKIWGQQGDQNHLEFLRRCPSGAFRLLADRIIARSNNIVLITQRVRKIDVNFRELCHIYIQCQKRIIGGEMFIFQNYWFGDDNIDAIEMSQMTKPKVSFFHAPPYFPFYDSYEIISKDGEYL